MKSSIVDSIKSLPPLQKTILDIQRIYADPEACIADLVKAIEHDPMIVANLLKAANSPLYSFGREIKNVAHAVSLFGMSMTRSIALGNSVRKLLNVDMEPYGITSDRFAEISNLQATLIQRWYKHINKQKAEKLFLAALLQESGKILIASDVLQEDLTYNFKSEIKTSMNIALVERSYVQVSSADVTAAIFEHWNFDDEFVTMIRYSDNPAAAPDEAKDSAMALNIIKTIVAVNDPLGERAITLGLKKAADAGYDHTILEDEVNTLLSKMDS